MIEFLEILKYTLPAIVVSFTIVFMLKYYIKADAKKKDIISKSEIHDKTIHLRLQAFERLVLFLERISPEQLVLRVDASGMDAGQYHRVLLQTVREEYEHNIAQQIYISLKAWELVKAAKESVIQLINLAKKDLKEDATSIDLASKIVELKMLGGCQQLDPALSFIKKEVAGLF